MNYRKKYLSLVIAALLGGAAPAWAGGGGGTSPPSGQVTLGAAADFAVLAGTNVTCTAGVIAGDVGVSPGSAVPFTNTGCTITGGTPPETNPAAARAQTALLTAYTALRSMPCTTFNGNLADVTLGSGVYCTDAVEKTGTLTLTGNGPWIFLVAGALTGTNFTVTMAGGQACNVFWAPTAGVTFTTSAMKGNILAGDLAADTTKDGSITFTDVTLVGRALANVAVSLTRGSVIGCDALSPDDSPSCKPRKHYGHDKDKDYGHDKDKDYGHDKDKGKSNNNPLWSWSKSKK